MITPAFISTAALTDETRLSIARIQVRLLEAQKELSTGRYADVGTTLGASTGVSVSLRQDLTQIRSIKDTNNTVLTRLKASQSAMQTISDDAQNFLAALVRAQSASAAPETVQEQAKTSLGSLADQLNSSINGQFLFSGINSDIKPVATYFADTNPASRQAIQDAFYDKFGFSTTDPQVANLSYDDVSDFLDNQFDSQFSDANWAANWSEASDRPVKNRISRTELSDTSITANEPFVRDIMKAYVMMADLGFSNMNDVTKQAVVSKATQLVGNAIGGIGQAQSFLGVMQERVTNANDQIDLQINFLTISIDGLESVDPNEVATRISLLSTQMEAAYSVTARLHELSLMNYLS